MLLFDLLRLEAPELEPSKCKVHLAGWNGHDDPLQVYLKGEFDSWQAWQSRRNFERDFVVSLIQLRERSQWLFVGAYQAAGSVEMSDHYNYQLVHLASFHDLAGKAVFTFERPGRQSYLNGETVASSCRLHEIKPEKIHLADFPGFKSVNVSFSELEIIIRQGIPSWRSALENVAGVYLISDQSDGKLYVGSATGAGGIWSRWCAYLNGHGDNLRLRKLIDESGRARAQQFRFSVLEIADTHTKPEDVVKRETHWKEVLVSRLHGHNGN